MRAQRRERAQRLTLGIALVTALLIGLGTSSASAYSANNPNWSNIPPISKARGSYGDLVGFWQAILEADGWYNKCVSRYPNNSIDGSFGTNTDSSTRTWQSRRGLAADGSVGPATWTKAYSRTIPRKGYLDDHQKIMTIYLGTAYEVVTNRYLPTDQSWWSPKGEWHWKSPTWPSGHLQPRMVTGVKTFYNC